MKDLLEYKDLEKATDMEDTLKKLREELREWPEEFIKRINGRVLELKFHKHAAYSKVEACIQEGNIFVVNKSGVVYIAGFMVDSKMILEFAEHQFPAVAITSVWKN